MPSRGKTQVCAERENAPVSTKNRTQRNSRHVLSVSLTLAVAALLVVAVGMHSLVQAQRVTESEGSTANAAQELDPTVYLSVISPTLAITLTAHPGQVHVSGETSLLRAELTDLFHSPIPDGTEVLFETSLGSLGSTSITKTTVSGVASATLTSGPLAGTAHITATADGSFAYTTVEFVWYEILLPLIARNF